MDAILYPRQMVIAAVRDALAADLANLRAVLGFLAWLAPIVGTMIAEDLRQAGRIMSGLVDAGLFLFSKKHRTAMIAQDAKMRARRRAAKK